MRTETKSYTPGAERAARAIYYAVEKAAAVNLPTLMAEIISRETHDAEMLEALKEVIYADANGDLMRRLQAVNLAKQVIAKVEGR